MRAATFFPALAASVRGPLLFARASGAHAHDEELNFGAAYAVPETKYYLWLETPTSNPFITLFAAASDQATETAIDNQHSTEQESAEHLLHEAEDGDGCVQNITSLLQIPDHSTAAANDFGISPNTTCAYRLFAAGAAPGGVGALSATSSGLPMRLFKLDLPATVNHILLFSTSTELGHLTLLDEEGHRIAPRHTIDEHAHGAAPAHADDHDHKPWGEVLAATLVVNAISLVGVFVLAAGVLGLKSQGGAPGEAAASSGDGIFSQAKQLDVNTSFAAQHARATARGPWIAASSAFAAGALLAAAVYFMWFEATHLFADGIEDAEESYLTFLWGTAILIGFLVTPVVNLAFETVLAAVGGGRGDDSIVAGQKMNPSGANADDAVVAEGVVMEKLGMPELQASKEQEEAAALKEQKQIQSLLISVLLGDFLHNFADGVFIGAAFLTCSHSKGWIVALGAVLHEIAQEIADYLLLTGPAKLSPVKALALNFASGLSVVFGGLLALASDYDKATIGFVMAFGGGTYVYIAFGGPR
eukprot:g18069.t1